MSQHYILKLDPQASSDWDRCVLRNPITGERPDLMAAIANAVSSKTGSYLIKVDLQVEILEEELAPIEQKIGLPQSVNMLSTKRLVS